MYLLAERQVFEVFAIGLEVRPSSEHRLHRWRFVSQRTERSRESNLVLFEEVETEQQALSFRLDVGLPARLAGQPDPR